MGDQRQNTTIYLAERPEYGIVPGRTFASKTEPAPTVDQLKDGEVLVETLYLSLDPSMRGIRFLELISTTADRKSYMPPVAIGQKMLGGAVSRVLGSKSAKAKSGDIVFSFSGWTEVAIVPEAAVDPIQVPPGRPATDILFAAINGGPGPTAYIGLNNIANIKKGDTVVVSTAAGGNGPIVGQLAKLYGAGRVIGLTGTDQKCDWLRREVGNGFDVALNYKSPTFVQDLEAATPDEVDVYWDNVGGQLLDTMLTRAAKNSRFVICGGISQYNTPLEERWGSRIQLRWARSGSGWRVGGGGEAQGVQHGAQGGIKEAESALVKMFEGENVGKLSLEVKAI
ncbi:NADP-dependent oxidoreductase YfmJ [Apiospora saccharicola]|uniref:NADP-dependent oxidoreductase YfmJ n=1 Tax=Apiospora saccharicola TaxID=335842 RepID=A0ABR1UGA0_9PEZI